MGQALTIDLNLATVEQVGEGGIRKEALEALAPKVKAAHQWLGDLRAKKSVGFFDLPFDTKAADEIVSVAKSLADFENLVVLGIGGSSLGPKALFAALCPPFHNLLPKEKRKGSRLFFPDNSDGTTFASLLETLKLDDTAVAAITKSGGTAETWAQLLVLLERFGSDASKHLVAVTDPEKGVLRKIATEQKWKTLPVPPSVGGRFSVLSPVGLLPAAAAGIDIHALLQGAGEMTKRCESTDLFKNPAYLLASTLYYFDTQKGRGIDVFMPYADALRETSDWFVQLWAESLGKKKGNTHVGPTPLRSVGATDQHSLLQLLMEGPQNKFTLFVAVETPRIGLQIPQRFPNEPELSYLGGHSFHELLSVEQKSTAAALAANGRPSLTINLPKLDANAVGQLMMLLEIATAFAGGLYEVDPFDQPGVEAGKRYACGLLGRPGYEQYAEELARRPALKKDWVA